MGKEIRAITAKEARALADCSDFTLRHIYKVIRDCATENSTSIEWSTCHLSNFALDVAINHLQEDGFTVEHKVEDNCLVIKW